MLMNLVAEMARNNLGAKDIADCIGVSEKTVRNYIQRRTKIPWDDALKIQEKFFPSLSLEYLFSKTQPAPDKSA